jgi:aspartate carbamoyltransferase catalytic subunit
MSLANRSLTTIDDFSNQEIEAVFSLADEMSESMGEQSSVCQGKIMASLFFEPSTRTRLSFEAAMHRLGGRVISVVEMSNTSLAKGESIADMARVVGSYADIIVIRHPWEGASKVVADYAGVPVVNAGDGGHEHPTQTLCDLYTLKKERKTLDGLKIALWGDLKHGRTIHSLAYALARFGATIHFRPGSGLGLPEHVTRKLTTEYGGILEKYEDIEDVGEEKAFPLDAIYITPSTPHQLANIPDVSVQVEMRKGVDALYVTRLQVERLESKVEGQELEKHYPVVDKKLLKGEQFRETIVMHPLPRVDELAYEIDADRRSMYFKQAARGVPIRMALIALLLGAKHVDIPKDDEIAFASRIAHPACSRHFGIRCKNEKCVSVQQTEARYIKHEFKIVAKRPLMLRCVYCEHEIHPPFIASSKWHEGTLQNKQYYSSDSPMLGRIKPENLIIFGSEGEAQARGFKPGRYASVPMEEQ